MRLNVFGACFLFSSMIAAPAFAGAKKESKSLPFDQIQWQDYAPGVPLKVATLWGDPAKGAHGRYLKMPAGFEAGIHSHTADYHGVLISGTWVHWDEGKSQDLELAPGSYVMQPGKVNHGDKCK